MLTITGTSAHDARNRCSPSAGIGAHDGPEYAQDRDDCPICQEEAGATAAEHRRDHTGWYWWPCFPGCLPDGDAFGPFASEAEALEDARYGIDDHDEAESEP